MSVGSINGVNFKAGVEKPTGASPMIQTTVSAPTQLKDSVSFGKKKDDDTVVYENTKVFKKAGAVIGGIGGIGMTISGFAKGGHGSLLANVLVPAIFIVGGPLAGALLGTLPDYMINKTVENTTKSIKKALDKKD